MNIEEINSNEILELISEANKITLKKHEKNISLERAIFLSWWCDKGDCAFCYMSSQKPKISDPKKSRRRIEAILAESELCSRLGWNIEFLSGGYGSFSTNEIKKIAEDIYKITSKPVWLNVGITDKIDHYGDEVIGITGAVEVANPKLHEKICPSKPLDEIENMLISAESLGFKKAITVILGLGETLNDLSYLFNMIEELKIDRVIFYSLNSHKETVFANKPQPPSLYYSAVVSSTRIQFPNIEIICGTWTDNLANIGPLILSGANGITKFPLFKMFGTKYGYRVEEEVKWSGRKLLGTFTNKNKLNEREPEIKENINFSNKMSKESLTPYIQRYIKTCLKSYYD